MRITALTVDGFGVWSGMALGDLGGEITVFYGDNEAGKTTLLEFIRSMLYGFSPDRHARYLPPVRPGRPGGMLRIVDSGMAYTIWRHADGGGPAGAISVLDDRGVTHDPRVVEKLLGEVDEPIFTNVFAVGLREVQQLGTLGGTEAARFLYDLALGVDGVSLGDVMDELETARNRLLASDGRPSLIVQLLGQRQRLQGELAELGGLSRQYLDLLAERDTTATEINRLETESARLAQDARAVDLARSLAPAWHRRVDLDHQLSGLGTVERLPEGTLATLDAITAGLAVRARRRVKIKRRRDQLRAEAKALAINEALRRHAPRLEALAEQQPWIESLSGDVAQLAARSAELEAAVAGDHKTWGGAATPTTAKNANPAALKASLRAQLKALAEVRGRRRAAKEEFTRLQASAADAVNRLQAKVGKNAPGGLTAALAAAGQNVSNLRRRVQLDDRIDQMSRNHTDLDDQSRDLVDQQLLPTWLLASIGSVFVLGCALILLFLIGLTLPAPLSRGLGWPVALLGVLLTGGAGAAKYWMERMAAERLDSCHGQLSRLRDQMDESHKERESLDRSLPRGGGPLVARLQAAEVELAGLEQLLPLEGERESAERAAGAARDRARDAGQEHKRLIERWRSTLTSAGLPATLSPKQLREYFKHGEEFHRKRHELAELAARLGERKTQCEVLVGRIKNLAADVGVATTSTDAVGQLRELLVVLRDQELRVKRRDALREEMVRLRRRMERTKRAVTRLQRRRHLLISGSGAADEIEFRRLAERQEERRRLLAAREGVAHELSTALTREAFGAVVSDYLESSVDLDTLARRTSDASESARQRLTYLLESRGRISQRLTSLETDRSRSQKQVELGMVQARLKDATRRWRVLATCQAVLERVLDRYERERQPAALREASSYLAEFTNGRYVRVWTPLGEHRLKVDDSTGMALPVEALSRGAREQVFLSLRLALVRLYADRGVRLPLVLDDVLVNFDATRTKAAVGVLRDFARAGHQLLIFTCHEHVARMFRGVKAEVRRLPDHEGGVVDLSVPVMAELVTSEPVLEELPVATAIETAVAPPAPPPVPPSPPIAREVIVAEVAPPRPAPVPPRPRTPRPARVPFSPGWDAEEFSGELDDRVRARRERDARGDDSEAA